MNLKELHTAENFFLKQFPEGFKSEGIHDIKKKHKFNKVMDYAQLILSKKELKHKKNSIVNITKFISKASMVSVFEKMRFRDFVKEIDDLTQFELVDSIYELIHGNEERGFNSLVNILRTYNLAKWPLVSAYLAYYRPQNDIFVKPTTVKRIIKYLELDTVVYNSKPTYEFYNEYRKIINIIKFEVDESLRPSNAAFSGFLMMTLPEK